MFRLIDRGWWGVMEQAARECRDDIRIVCPFITQGAVDHIVRTASNSKVHVITRFNLEDWSKGVSSPKALRTLPKREALIRGVQDLHAKLFVFDDCTAILGSTNLTDKALGGNHELGVLISDQQSVRCCSQYFDELWRDAGATLTAEVLSRYEAELDGIIKANGAAGPRPIFPDYGTKISRVSAATPVVAQREGAEGAFVKFFGTTRKRFLMTDTIESEVRRSGCHWACGYSKRPRNVKHGSMVFFARLMRGGTTIFGRAIAVPYRRGEDDATAKDIKDREWKRDWPYHVRVLRPELVAGTFANGVSLFQLMDDLGSDSFLTTQEHAKSGIGNTNPRAALTRQPAAALTKQAYSVLTERLERAFAVHGKLELEKMADLDWPEHVSRLTPQGRQLLDTLRQRLAAGIIDPVDPLTFPRYKDIPPWFGLEPSPGPALIRQVRNHCGLDSLDQWSRRYGLPAISGLVVTDRSGRIAPGELFFGLHDKQRSADLSWWLEEVRRAAEYDWERVLD